MATKQTWLDRWVDGLPKTRMFQFIADHVIVPYWAWRTPVPPQPGGPPPAMQPGDNLQHMMNLVMPLKDKSPIGRAKAALAVAQNIDEIYTGLDNVGTVHFARFVIVGDNLCMFSVYDGDFTNYIRDFVATIGNVFNAVVALIEGGDAVLPTEKNVDAFIAWVHAHDMYQIPDLATGIIEQQRPASTLKPGEKDDLTLLPRSIILQLKANPNVSLGSGYRNYPGFSAAQVRHHAGVGW
jgi:hypothetical protein